MPIDEYYGGEGRKVYASMQEKYGPETGKRVFYATANKRGLAPSPKPNSPPMKALVAKRKTVG